MKNPLVKHSLILAALFVAIGAIFFLLILPTVRDVRAIQNDLALEQQRLEERYRQGLLLRRLRDDWEKVRADVGMLNTAVLRYDMSIPFITRLESLASEHRVAHRLTLPLLEKNERTKNIATPFTLQWDGTWEAILRMLIALEREPYYLPIETIHATSNRMNTSAFALPSPSLPKKEGEAAQTITMILTGNTIWTND